MLRHLPLLLVTLMGLAVGVPAQAACTAGNPNANIPESTPTGAFTVNGDGTVTHSLTGLTWKQCAQGQSGASCTTGSATAMTWSGALASAAADSTAGGGWRLPNEKELRSIVEQCGYGAAINQTVFPAAAASPHWSGSTYLGATTDAWIVDFAAGVGNHNAKSTTNVVRLVRGGQMLDAYDAQNNTIPTGFSFAAQNNVAPGSVVTSNTITVAGLGAASPISIVGGTYSINGGTYTSASGTVNNGDTVTVRLTASSSNSVFSNAVLSIGSITASFNVTTMPAAGASQTISGLPVSIPGATSLPGIVNLGSGAGSDFANRLAVLLSNALGVSMRYVGQSAQGTGMLGGYFGGSLAFMPISAQSDGRANGVYGVGNGQYQVVYQGQSVTIVPGLVHLDQLLAQLPGVAASVTNNGVIVANYNGVVYAAQPRVMVGAAAPGGTAQLLLGSDGFYSFTDAQGNVQTLFPAFADVATLLNTVPAIFPGTTASVQLNGSVIVTGNGSSVTLVPDLALGGIPPEHAGQSWWQESSTRYRMVNTQTPAAAGTSQGFTAK